MADWTGQDTQLRQALLPHKEFIQTGSPGDAEPDSAVLRRCPVDARAQIARSNYSGNV